MVWAVFFAIPHCPGQMLAVLLVEEFMEDKLSIPLVPPGVVFDSCYQRFLNKIPRNEFVSRTPPS